MLSPKRLLTALLGASLLAAPIVAGAQPMELELVRPDGIVILDPIDVNPHPDTLDGKIIALKWTEKPNGDILLSRIADLIEENYPNTTVLRTWQMSEHPYAGLLRGWSTNKERSVQMAQVMASLTPDLVIGGQGD